jgi:hypothetical protein
MRRVGYWLISLSMGLNALVAFAARDEKDVNARAISTPINLIRSERRSAVAMISLASRRLLQLTRQKRGRTASEGVWWFTSSSIEEAIS